MLAEHSLAASSRVAVVSGVECEPPSSTLSSLSLAPGSPPLPIPGIRPMQTPDTPVNVFVVVAVINVALSLLCPLPVTAGGTQPLRQLACHHRPRGGLLGCNPPSLTSSSLLPLRRDLLRCPFPVSARRGPRAGPLMSLSPSLSCSSHLVSLLSSSPHSREGVDVTCLGGERWHDAIHPLSQLDEQHEHTPEDRGDRSSPSNALRRPSFPSSPPLQGCSLLSLAASMTFCASILETLSDVRGANHSHWLSCAP